MSTDFTPEELAEFDRLTNQQVSYNQLERINGRISLAKFIDRHGKEKCDAMWNEIKKRDDVK